MTNIALEPTTDVVVDLVPHVHSADASRQSALRSKLTLVVCDALALAAAAGLTVGARTWAGIGSVSELLLAAAIVPLWLACIAQRRLYVARYVTRPLEELRRIVGATTTLMILLAAVSFMVEAEISRGLLVFLALLGSATVVAERAAVRWHYDRLRATGKMLRPVIVVGANEEGRALAEMLRTEPRLGYEVRGYVDDDLAGDWVDGLYVHGPVAMAANAVAWTDSIGVIVAASACDLGSSNQLIRELTDLGVHVELSSTLQDIASHRLMVRPLGRFPVVYIEPVHRSGWRPLAKRAFDVAVSAALLTLTLPLLVLAAIAIKLDSPGPVVFRQRRIGRGARPFTIFKLRTMEVDAEDRLSDLLDQNEADGPLFKMASDPRVTRVGRFLRTSSIDELPQLWNVIRGEMSLVGPRPALPREVEAWDEALHGRLRVQPGVTGMWQVSGRSDASFADYARLDLYYVDNWSLASDLAIVARTPSAVLARRGAA